MYFGSMFFGYAIVLFDCVVFGLHVCLLLLLQMLVPNALD